MCTYFFWKNQFVLQQLTFLDIIPCSLFKWTIKSQLSSTIISILQSDFISSRCAVIYHDALFSNELTTIVLIHHNLNFRGENSFNLGMMWHPAFSGQQRYHKLCYIKHSFICFTWLGLIKCVSYYTNTRITVIRGITESHITHGFVSKRR